MSFHVRRSLCPFLINFALFIRQSYDSFHFILLPEYNDKLTHFITRINLSPLWPRGLTISAHRSVLDIAFIATSSSYSFQSSSISSSSGKAAQTCGAVPVSKRLYYWCYILCTSLLTWPWAYSLFLCSKLCNFFDITEFERKIDATRLDSLAVAFPFPTHISVLLLNAATLLLLLLLFLLINTLFGRLPIQKDHPEAGHTTLFRITSPFVVPLSQHNLQGRRHVHLQQHSLPPPSIETTG